MGLGNPGECYARTRHNLGYRVVSSLYRLIKAGKPFQLRHSCCATASHRSQRVLLAQPRTFMNLSGRAVMELIRRYRLRPDQFILIYDDLDLPPGWLRLRLGGGSGGHRGVQSVIETTGSAGFLRLRIGIGKPVSGDAAAHVLAVPPPGEQEILDQSVERAAGALLVFLEQGLEEAMNRFNRPP